MKKLTIQFLCLTLILMAISVNETFAQRIRFKDGKAKVRAKIKANSEKIYTISGKDFKKLRIRQKRGGKFKYEIRLGSELLSSGYTTNFKIIKSDGKSTYKIKVINELDKERKLDLIIVKMGSGLPIGF